MKRSAKAHDRLAGTRRRLFVWGPLLLLSVSAVAACISILVLYRVSYQQQKARLEEAVETEARLVETLARLNGFDAEKTLEQLCKVQEHHKGIGKTGECLLGVLDGDKMRYLPHHQHDEHPTPSTLPLAESLDEPMQRALQGKTGTYVGPDYRGNTVLAAYRPIPGLNWGGVAKIDLSEIRAPFLQAALAVFCAIGVLVGGAIVLLIRLDRPIIAELEESEERYRLLVETTSDLVWEVDCESVFAYVNPKVTDLLGYQPKEVVGKTSFDLMSAEEAERVARLGAKLVEPGKPFAGLEVTHEHKSGRQVVVEVSGVPIFDEDGKWVGYRGISRDVTERKRAEEALQKERQILKHLLESSDRERQLTAYEIHDGLAQQLTAATMHLQVSQQLQAAEPEAAAKAHREGVALVEQAVSEARRLIGGLRPPILDEMGIVSAVEHLANGSQNHSAAEIEFLHKVEFQRLAPVLENALFRIVQESLTNAQRHSRSDKVRIELRQVGERVRVEVQDWGVGFADEEVGKSCFGLEGIRERARLLGGTATIDSSPGQGTRIVVELPLMEQEPAAEP